MPSKFQVSRCPLTGGGGGGGVGGRGEGEGGCIKWGSELSRIHPQFQRGHLPWHVDHVGLTTRQIVELTVGTGNAGSLLGFRRKSFLV